MVIVLLIGPYMSIVGHYEEVWKALGRAEWGNLEFLGQGENHAFRIAYRIHGDAFRAFHNQKMMALSWKASSAIGDSWKTRILFALVPCRMMVKQQRGALARFNTLAKALRCFAAMLNILHTGVMPADGELPDGITVSHNCCKSRRPLNPHGCCSHGGMAGAPIAGPWRWGFAGVTGDLEFLRDANLQVGSGRYWACKEVCCSKCFASAVSEELSYKNVSPAAAWRNTLVTTPGLLAGLECRYHPPLKQLQGWRHELNLEDCLHVIFLGVGSDIVGSTIKFLCKEGFYGDGPLPARVDRCREAAVTFTRRETAMPSFAQLCKSEEFPVLETKGAMVKQLLKFISAEASVYALTSHSVEATQVAEMNEALQEAVEACGKKTMAITNHHQPSPPKVKPSRYFNHRRRQLPPPSPTNHHRQLPTTANRHHFLYGGHGHCGRGHAG